MTIPLDRLYHYIESVAQDIRGDAVLIYRFTPHGSKKIEHLTGLYDYFNTWSWRDQHLSPQIYCNDQEPLDYNAYNKNHSTIGAFTNLVNTYYTDLLRLNLRHDYRNIYDKYILLHSEKKSPEVVKYQNSECIPVYYWCHALIALDWFRFAQYEKFKKSITHKFLIYSRAWSGTREYRLKFADLLIANGLIDDCKININPIEPELDIHYTQHDYANELWRPDYKIEDYVSINKIHSSASADYDRDDYNATEFEIVLETLFDDKRLHLTEKALRPLACQQPFILVATHGSLEYLRSYGFKTYGEIINESYDLIEDPLERLKAVVDVMKEIASWTEEEHQQKMLIAKQIAEYNRAHFFSAEFVEQVNTELAVNLTQALTKLEETNTSNVWLTRCKAFSKIPEIVDLLDASRKAFDNAEVDFVTSKAVAYFEKAKSNKY